MNCPTCHQPTYVLEARPAPGGATRRRRVCEGCLQRFSTYEIPCDPNGRVPANLPLPKAITERAARLPQLHAVSKSKNHRRRRVCKNCELWSKHGCSLGIPEAGGLTAVACKHYECIYDDG